MLHPARFVLAAGPLTCRRSHASETYRFTKCLRQRHSRSLASAKQKQTLFWSRGQRTRWADGQEKKTRSPRTS
ncbi:hypothetical protein M431DRAFT_261356 [Trichoderma harzianum CBS 226.95]|uniref:Uncharacterized protein n=1 Tax=Trichoderma harzianum CBS 226.95 TaxID=983964 RepID=A0A2T3ZZ83_TRIHA|nr:hypothetical protein M431DRAFT_261356 [Trichoderma harzianum CBS 226.95]PTB50126.1 hypothetical protein M431DRAFT_261356 [Trichoderma harzianum CBS 226.95]